MAKHRKNAKKSAAAERIKDLKSLGVPKHPSKASPKQPMSVSTTTAERKPLELHVTYEKIADRRPVWRFSNLDREWPAGARHLTTGQLRELHVKLGDYETQKLSEIWHPGSQCHKYLTEDLPDSALRRLSDLSYDDETAIHSLRVNGKYRVHGILRKHIFYVLWIDPEHEVWPSPKKHT